MNKNFSIFITIFILWSTTAQKNFAQVPQSFSFQGIAVDGQENPVSEQEIKIDVKLLQGSPNGSVQFHEMHEVTTNTNGLYALSIGLGNVILGEFANIDWSNIPMYLSIGIDINGGNNFVLAGITQLLSVPYALKAGSADIAPSIYVKSNPFGSTARVVNQTSYNGLGGIKYIYEWIQGTPEDVFVHYEGLPDNVSIYTNAVSGFGLDMDEISSSKVEIIKDGIQKRQSFLGVTNTSISVPVGTYNLNLVFKTKEGKELARLPYVLIIE